jgi:hypothetical protein
VQRIDETHARLDIAVNPLITCVQCQPDTLGLDLGRFSVGSHVMNADIAQHVVAGPDSGQCGSSTTCSPSTCTAARSRRHRCRS